jgi:hypothetical protein
MGSRAACLTRTTTGAEAALQQATQLARSISRGGPRITPPDRAGGSI